MAISPFFKPTRVVRPAGGGLISAARNNIRSIQTKTQNISEPRSNSKSQKFGSAYTNFFGSKKTVKILQKNLTAIKKSLASTFEIAIALRKSIAQMAKGFGGGGKKGGLFGGLLGGLGGLLGIAGGLFGLISGAAALLTNPWILGIAAGGMLWLTTNPKFRKLLQPIVLEIVRNLLPRINKGKIDDPQQLTSDTIKEIGPERTLAVLKTKLNELEIELENTNYFTEHGKHIQLTNRIAGIKQEVKSLENRGVVASATSGEQFDSDMALLNQRFDVRGILNEMRRKEKMPFQLKLPLYEARKIAKERGIKEYTNWLEITRTDEFNAILEKLRSTNSQQLKAIDTKYDNILKHWEEHGSFPEGFKLQKGKYHLQSLNTSKEVSSLNGNGNGNNIIVPYEIGNKSGGVNPGQTLKNNIGDTTTGSDIAWFSSRNTDMYGCFKTAAECNITV